MKNYKIYVSLILISIFSMGLSACDGDSKEKGKVKLTVKKVNQ